jgi:methylase of polypeptide subunit release factors
MATEMSMPMTFDLITCNPPWLPASYLTGSLKNISSNFDLDNAVYDPKEQFLLSSFNFAKYHMESDGEMLMIYSNLAANLGL